MNQQNIIVKQGIQVLDHSFLNAFQVLKKCRDNLHPLLQMLLYLSQENKKGKKGKNKENKEKPCNFF